MPVAEEFIAHKANVNCLAMGHKSNQVLATGGDDKKVNLWAIGRQSCLMVCILKYCYILLHCTYSFYHFPLQCMANNFITYSLKIDPLKHFFLIIILSCNEPLWLLFPL